MFNNEQTILAKLLSKGRYYDALEMCRQNGIDDSDIKRAIDQRLSDGIDFLSEQKYTEANSVFIELIGAVKPGIVISLICDNKYHSFLIDYLISVHKKGFSDSLCTKLLFNLFIQCYEMRKLSAFIEYVNDAYLKKSQKIIDPQTNRFLQNFDADAAIEVLQMGGMDNEAQTLIQVTGISNEKILELIKQKKYIDAATLIFDHFDEPIGFKLVTKFGPLILKNDCNAGKIIEQTATLIWSNGKVKDDRSFIKLFWGFPLNCYLFLKSIIKQNPTPFFANILISLLIPNPKATDDSFFGNPKISNSDEAINLISDKSLEFDVDYVFIMCADAAFVLGTIYLFARIGKINESISLFLKDKLYSEFCKWIQTKPDIQQSGYCMILKHILSLDDASTVLTNQTMLSVFKKSISICKALFSNEYLESAIKKVVIEQHILQDCLTQLS